ncbi:hypothetical protein DMENIID0001_037700 [Sergentomyia squamirostris]
MLRTVKMRRNVKFLLFLSISWMFIMVYYFQSNNAKTSNSLTPAAQHLSSDKNHLTSSSSIDLRAPQGDDHHLYSLTSQDLPGGHVHHHPVVEGRVVNDKAIHEPLLDAFQHHQPKECVMRMGSANFCP